MANFTDTKVVDNQLLKRDISFTDSQQLYREWAIKGNYDQMLRENPRDYNALLMYTDAMKNLYSDKSSVRVLDIGAGTGLSGEKLREVGYKKVDGLEPCDKFIEIITEKAIYDNIIGAPIGGDSKVDIPDGTYDACAVVGCFAPGHIPTSAIPEIVRIIKPGGFFVNCMRHQYLEDFQEYKDNLVPTLDRLEAEGKIKKLEWTVYPNHFAGHDGLRMVYAVL